MRRVYTIAAAALIGAIALLVTNTYRLSVDLRQSQVEVSVLKRELDESKMGQVRQLYRDYEEKVRTQIEQNINTLIQGKPDHLGQWFVTKIVFIGPYTVRVEYEDGHYANEARFRILNPNDKLIIEVLE